MTSPTSNKFWDGKNVPPPLHPYFFFVIVSGLLLTVAKSFGMNTEDNANTDSLRPDLVFGTQAVRSHIFFVIFKGLLVVSARRYVNPT